MSTTSEARYAYEETNGCAVIVLRGTLNDCQWTDVDQVGTDLLGRLDGTRRPKVLVDLSELEYIGSSMVAMIVRLWKAIKERQGTMVVVNTHEVVGEVLRISRLDAMWTIVETRQEAFRALGGHGGGSGSGTGGAAGWLLVVALVALLAAAAGAGLTVVDNAVLAPATASLIGLSAGLVGAVAAAAVAVTQHERRVPGIVLAVLCLAAAGFSAWKGPIGAELRGADAPAARGAEAETGAADDEV